jgi:putative hydrolase of the HAD superfamily
MLPSRAMSERDAERTRLRAVTFDCWGTLLFERDPEQARALRVDAVLRVARRGGAALEPAAARAALDGAFRRHSDAWHAHRATGSAEMAGWVLESLAFPTDTRRGLAEELERALAEASLESEIAALEGSRETLEWLAGAGLRRALVCDTGFSPGRVVRRLLARTGLLELLEVQAFSDEVGVPKPEARIFEYALDGLGAAAPAALHVGDLRRTDIAGARSLGMRTVRIRGHFDDPSEHAEADHVADSHAHLRELLAALRSPA